MKNTVCGRRGKTRKSPSNPITELELVLEEIMKQTYLNDVLVEDHFREYTGKYSDIRQKEFDKAMKDINLDYTENELKEIFTNLQGRERKLECSMIDAAVEDTLRLNVNEVQKTILDHVYSNLKSDPMLRFTDIFQKFDHDSDNKITIDQFVLTLEPKCLNLQVSDLYFLAKRYVTKHHDCVYYNDFVDELDKLTKNIDPIKEWMADI